MASKKKSTAQWIDAKLVIPDYGNMRTKDYTQDEAWEPFCHNIRFRGQKEPVLVRNHPSKKGRFQLIYGYRRLGAILTNAHEDGEKNPQILARIEPNMSDLEARLENTRENLAREGVAAADVAWALHDLSNEFAEAGEAKSATDVVMLGGGGLSLNHGTKLLRIMAGLKTSLAEQWRGTSREIPIDTLDEIAKMPANKQETAWKEALEKKAKADKEKPKGGRDKWVITQGSRLEELVRFVFTLQADDLLPPALDEDFLVWCENNGFYKPGKNRAGKHDAIVLKKMNDAAQPDKCVPLHGPAGEEKSEAAE